VTHFKRNSGRKPRSTKTRVGEDSRKPTQGKTAWARDLRNHTSIVDRVAEITIIRKRGFWKKKKKGHPEELSLKLHGGSGTCKPDANSEGLTRTSYKLLPKEKGIQKGKRNWGGTTSALIELPRWVPSGGEGKGGGSCQREGRHADRLLRHWIWTEGGHRD